MSISLTAMVQKQIQVKTVSVHAKVGDCGYYEFKSPEGTSLKELQEGYVPDFFPGNHHGDYLILDIDIETGQITNWKKPEAGQIKEIFDNEE